MSATEELRQQLARALLARPLAALATADPAALQGLAAARQRLAPPRGHRALPRIAQGILAFRLLGRQTPYPDLKYACYGIARPTDWEGRLLLYDARLCDELLATVAALQHRRPWMYAACCQGLAAAWAADIATTGETPGITAHANAGKLANFLRRTGYLT